MFIGFIRSEDALEGLWKPMTMLNVWRIPLLFFVSGMGLYFAMKKRNWKQLFIERSKRIQSALDDFEFEDAVRELQLLKEQAL